MPDQDPRSRIRRIVEALCSERCAGRAPGSPEGANARAIIVDELRTIGLEPVLQEVPPSSGTNVLAEIRGDLDDRWVIVAAHYDHLGRFGDEVYWGADDNAAAVAVLLEVARALVANPPAGRSVLIAAFDCEEPPWFGTTGMGSCWFTEHPTVPLDRVDMMICMDLVGHGLGPAGLPDEVTQSVLALGAERSAGTPEIVDRLARAVDGVVLRRLDTDVIPPMSDYWAFRDRQVPYLFLSCGRWEHYHQPTDTPEKLDYPKTAALAAWLEIFVRENCARTESRVRYRDQRDDAGSLQTFIELIDRVKNALPMAEDLQHKARDLLTHCDESGSLPDERRGEIARLAELVEFALGGP